MPELKNLPEIAVAVAAAMGSDWSYVPHDESFSQNTYSARLVCSSTGVELWLSSTWAGNGRLYISGTYKKAPVQIGVWKYGEDTPHITVGVTRPAEAIAKEIKRRLLADVEHLTRAVREWIRVDKARTEAMVRCTDQVCGACVAHHIEPHANDEQQKVWFRDGRFSGEASVLCGEEGPYVTLSLSFNRVTPADMGCIFAALEAVVQ